MLDYLAIGISELGSISERRIERLCNPSLSGLPAFLVADGGRAPMLTSSQLAATVQRCAWGTVILTAQGSTRAS